MNRIHRIATSLSLVIAASALSTALFAAPQAKGKPSPVQVAQVSKEEMATGTWTVDKAHTDIAFTVTHLGVSKTRGSFTDFDGTVIADGKKPEGSSVQFTIKADSINTGNPQRDAHLKSKDFFETDKYPTITFKSTRVTKRSGGFTAVGNLTMHGVTKQVTLPFTVSGPSKGPDKKLHLGVDTSVALDRKDYGLTWSAVIEGSQVVGETVTVTISMELTK